MPTIGLRFADPLEQIPGFRHVLDINTVLVILEIRSVMFGFASALTTRMMLLLQHVSCEQCTIPSAALTLHSLQISRVAGGSINFVLL